MLNGSAGQLIFAPAQPPVFVDIPQGTQPTAGVLGFVNVLFCPGVGLQKRDASQVRPCLKPVAGGRHGLAVGSYSASGAESCAVTDIARTFDLINIAALGVGVGDGAQCKVIGDRPVQYAFELVARVAVFGEGGAQVERAIGTRRIWLIGDKANVTRLRTRAKQRALRTRQYFDAIEISRIDVKVAARLR